MHYIVAQFQVNKNNTSSIEESGVSQGCSVVPETPDGGVTRASVGN